mgnify:CR=1 FL=1
MKSLGATLALVAVLLLMVADKTWADPDLAGAIELDSAPLALAPILVLSLDGIQFQLTNQLGQFILDHLESGPFVLTSLFFVSGSTFLDGSLFRDGVPLPTALVLLLQAGGPKISFIWWNGTYSFANLNNGLTTLLIFGFAMD